MNDLRESLERRGVVYGCFSLLVEPVYVELLGMSGFDFVVADCEEAPGDNYGARLEDLVRAADAVSTPTIVRVIENIPGGINRALNSGAAGIFVPHVRSAAEARAIVSAGRYPPLGRRGAAPVVRAARYGLEDWREYHARSNEDILIFVMVEDLEGVRNIEEIVQVPGIDGVMVGTWDLSVEMDRAQYGPLHPDVMEQVEHVISVTREAGLFMCGHAWSGDAAAKYIELGCQLMFISLDSTLMVRGLTELKAIADRVEGRPA